MTGNLPHHRETLREFNTRTEQSRTDSFRRAVLMVIVFTAGLILYFGRHV